MIKDGEGTVLQRFDYYPFGSESRVWTAGTSTPQSALRYRFGGKEIAGQKASASALAGIPATAAGSPYLDFGARLYDPRTAAWLSQDPLSEKYYPVSPYAYCAGNPANLVDPDGKSWYFSKLDGSFVSHIEDEDDRIYLLTEDQIQQALDNNLSFSIFRDLDMFSNSFGQMNLNNTISDKAVTGVLKYLFSLANKKGPSMVETYISSIKIIVDFEKTTPIAESKSSQITLFPKSGNYWRGYDIISTMAHEIGHILDRKSGVLTNKKYNENKASFEKRADDFAKQHWSFAFISTQKKREYDNHAIQYGF